MAKTTCKHCGAEIKGTGAHNAVLCIECWSHILVRYEHGEKQQDLAREVGVTPAAFWMKRKLYGPQD